MQRITYSFLAVTLLLAASVTFDSCADHDLDDLDPCDDVDAAYAADVRPIIETKCSLSGCHNGSLGPERNWLVFESLQEAALSGTLAQMVESGQMPPAGSPGGTLTNEQIRIISCWAGNGAPND